VLLTAGAIVAIGVGGGLVRPMQDRWERMLTAAERETTTQYAAYQQGRTDAMRGSPVQQRRPAQPTMARQAMPPGGTQGDTPQGGGGYAPPNPDDPRD
jgi:hypothetical protein